MTGIPAAMYLGGVVLKTHVVGLFSAVVPIIIFWGMSESIIRLGIVVLASLISSVSVIYLVGLDNDERRFLKDRIFSKI